MLCPSGRVGRLGELETYAQLHGRLAARCKGSFREEPAEIDDVEPVRSVAQVELEWSRTCFPAPIRGIRQRSRG